MKTKWIVAGVILVGIILILTTITISKEPVKIANNENADMQDLPILLDFMPAIEGIASWINSEPLTNESLRGNVVLVDFMTYSCINCTRTFPFLNDWWVKYKDDDFLIIGVHSPEFDFEKDRNNVIEATKKYGIEFPVAQDNDFVTWHNFNNRYWPAKYIFDKEVSHIIAAS
jgi:thiol-disulfide isomerase/thioredoxin